MKKNTIASVLVRKTLVLVSTALMIAPAAVGCGQSPVEGDAEGQVSPVEGDAVGQVSSEPVAVDQQAVLSCCSWGYYRCPTDGEQFDYDPPGCGGIYTKPQARIACENYCPDTCEDHGWFISC